MNRPRRTPPRKAERGKDAVKKAALRPGSETAREKKHERREPEK